MTRSRPPGPPSPEDDLVLQAQPQAIQLARVFARLYWVHSDALIKDCEQVACQALLVALPGYDNARGLFWVYAWKRVAGAVTRFLCRELGLKPTGGDDALDETEGFQDVSDPFDDYDDDAMGQLKGFCRFLTFRRFMGNTRELLQEGPDDALLRARVLEALKKALGELTEQEMRLLELRYWEELTWERVAEAMGVGDRQAKRIDERLRERLRRDLRRRGVEDLPSAQL